MFRLKALVAISFLAAQPALAADLNRTSFEADGQHFDYTTELRHGVVRIEGLVVESREPFSLLVDRYGRVSGYFGANPVDFRVSAAARDRLFADVKDSDLASAR